MAVKYTVTHKGYVGGQEVPLKIELHEDGFSGTATEIKGDAGSGVFEHDYERLTAQKPFDKPIQKSSLTLHFVIQSDSDLTILTDIINAGEDKYQLVKKVSGSEVWRGKALPDMVEYAERDYPITGSVTAKDLSSLEGYSYGLKDTQPTLITAIADIVNGLGYGLDIHTYTNWRNQNDQSDDYLNIIHINTFNLRNYAQADGEEDTAFTDFRALEEILRANNLILRQANNAWHLYHISALQNPTAVQRYVYDSTGTQQSSGTVDLTHTVNNADSFILPNSINQHLRPAKSTRRRFDHRTLVYGFDLPSRVILQEGDPAETFSQDFNPDGNQTIEYSGQVRLIEDDAGASDAEVDLVLRSGSYYWDGSQWLNSVVNFTVQCPQNINDTFYGSFSFETSAVPSAADGQLAVQFLSGTTSAGTADRSEFRELSFNVNNPSVEDGNNVAIITEIEQTGIWSSRYDYGDILFGDGPTSYSPARLMYDSSGTLLATEDGEWGFVVGDNTTSDKGFHELACKEIINFQRNPIRNLQGLLKADYSPHEVVDYDSNNYFFLGGVQTGYDVEWNGFLLKIDVSDDSNDTVTTFYETSTGGGTSSTASGGTSGGGTFDPEVYDSRWFNIDDAFDELATADIDTALTNLGLKDGSRGLDLNSVIAQNNAGGWFTARVTDDSRSGVFSFQDSASNSVGQFILDGLDGLGAGYLEVDSFDRVDFLQPISSTGDILSGSTYGKPSFVDNWISVGTSATRSAIGILGNASTDTAIAGVYFGNVASTETDNRIAQIIAQRDGHDNAGIVRIDAFDSTATQVNMLSLSPSGGTLNVDLTGEDAGFISNRASGGWFTAGVTDDTRSSVFTFQDSASNNVGRFTIDGMDGAGAGYLEIDSFDKIRFFQDQESDNFASGWIADGGQGYSIFQDASATAQYNAEFNNLLVRGRMKVFELIVKQIATLGGTEILSVAVAEADSVSGSAGSETVSITDPRGFGGTSLADNDLVIVQRVDLNDTTVVKQEFRTVDGAPSGTDVSFTSTSGAPAPSDAIEPGDIIVSYGNTTDTARQNMMYRSVEGELVSRFQSGVDSYADFNSPGATSQLIMGDLDDAQALGDGTVPSGFGFYTKGDAFFDGHMVAQTGAITDYITAGGDTYIGTNVSRFTAEDTVVLGDWNGSFHGMRVRGADTGGGANYVSMFARSSNYFFNIVADGQEITRIDSDSAQFFGAFVDDSGLWAGGGATSNPSTKSDSNFWAKFDTGEFFYEAMVITVWARNSIAGFGAGSTADSLQNNEWTAQRSSSVAGENVIENKIKARYRHRFGINNMLLNYLIRVDSSGDGTGTGAVYLTVRDQSGTSVASDNIDLGPSGITEDTLEVDISSLNPGQYYVVEVDLEAQVGNVNSGTVTITSYLREDAIIYATT